MGGLSKEAMILSFLFTSKSILIHGISSLLIPPRERIRTSRLSIQNSPSLTPQPQAEIDSPMGGVSKEEFLSVILRPGVRAKREQLLKG